jgi:hypothetical protein
MMLRNSYHPRIAIGASLLLITSGAITACSKFSLDTYWRSGTFVLIAVDTRGQMSLAIDDKSGMSSALVGPTIFSIGADDRYIVIKQHPSKDAFGGFDRSLTKYFVVDRAISLSSENRQKAVRGPLDENEFRSLTVTQSLPPFTKTFDDLK